MENTEIITTESNAAILEKVVVDGDLSKLSPEQRLDYYRQFCQSCGLNPLTKPFDYIRLNNKLTLYARKDATDQLRKIHGVNIDDIQKEMEGEWYIITVKGSDKTGRKDMEIGCVNKRDMQGNIGNALMKAVTKAKRRLTLSLCGLGWLDETEIETISTAQAVIVNDDGIIEESLPEPQNDFDEEGFLDSFNAPEDIPYFTPAKAREELDSHNVAYKDIPTQELSYRYFTLLKYLRRTDISDNKRSDARNKLGIICANLGDRKAKNMTKSE